MAQRAASSGGGGCGKKYTYAQLEALWINAGGPKKVAPIAAAIAEAESGGCTRAENPTDNGGKQTSWGLWQISNGTHSKPSANWSNGPENARLAVAKYKGAGNSFSPWGTYSSGAYRAFINNKATPNQKGLQAPPAPAGKGTSSTPPGKTPPPAPSVSSSSSSCVLSAPSFLGFSLGGCLFSKTEARALIGGLVLATGAVTGTLGVAVLVVSAFGKTKAGKAAGKVIAATPQGRVLKAGKAVSGARKASEQTAQERHTANQYRRQPAARRRLEADEDRASERAESGRDRARRMANPPRTSEPVPF